MYKYLGTVTLQFLSFSLSLSSSSSSSPLYQVSRLCDLQDEGDSLTSVSWSEQGQNLAVGTQSGHVQVWDTLAEKKLYDLRGHHARVGTCTQGFI